jgi:hypothetical protein
MEQLELFDPLDAANFNEGVRLLVSRMKTNPEEFAGSDNKWGKILTSNYSFFLTSQEVKYLKEKLLETHRNNFTTAVLKVLTESE